ncbi:anti-sigma factor family protein [Paenibacillus ginsengihumi]|uniref:anti-sigma factor family protein n=1 Tax=Paenibacillus ginsengihumi TaxID=431596 RepID=UPI000381AFA4|nr:zf-HC2 domain-containing protein [Paenibacillus ginsengihumi]
MKCRDVQELLGMYWDLPETDLRRQAVNEHTKHCSQCSEEFDIWLESTMLIQSAVVDEEPFEAAGERSISSSVMKRIYEDESWRLPVADRMYRFSYKLRRNVTAVIAACLAIFIFTFAVSLIGPQGTDSGGIDSAVFGRIGDPVVIAAGQSGSMNAYAMPTTAVASLKGFNDPIKMKVGPIRTVKDYLLFVSLLGFTSTLLIMNWLSRTRS